MKHMWKAMVIVGLLLTGCSSAETVSFTPLPTSDTTENMPALNQKVEVEGLSFYVNDTWKHQEKDGIHYYFMDSNHFMVFNVSEYTYLLTEDLAKDFMESTDGFTLSNVETVYYPAIGNVYFGQGMMEVNGDLRFTDIVQFVQDDQDKLYVFMYADEQEDHLNFLKEFFSHMTIVKQKESTPTPEVTTEVEKEEETMTMGQKNALSSANSYLRYSNFSYNGLIEQLEFEGYTHEDAVYAVDHCGADWNAQALGSAKSYLRYSAFSYSGLVEQLEYEQYTHEQAVYGVENSGADWYEQAAKSAQSYLQYMSFSRDELISQLQFEGFSYEQAEYGVSQNGY